MENTLALPKLYKINAKQEIVTWQIEADLDLKMVHVRWKNGTNKEQGHSFDCKDPVTEAERRHKEQIDRKGYSVVIPSKVPDLPMLAQVWGDRKREFERVAIQPKLDGHRCLATNKVLMSRRKERITSVPHIRGILRHLPEGVTLDGELYVHGTPLQTLASYVRRENPHYLHKQIQYHVFDIAVENTPFEERFVALTEIIDELEQQYLRFQQEIMDIPAQMRPELPVAFPIKVVTTTFVDGSTADPEVMALIKDEFKKARQANFEGLMLRNADSEYEFNRRSPNLLKYKEFLDEEFEIVDIQEVSGQMGQFVCKTEEGKIFEVTPAWTHEAKRRLLLNSEYYIGRWLHVTFEKYSNDNIPIPPIGHLTYGSKTERTG